MKTLLTQTILLIVFGVVLGFTVNFTSEKPIPLIRQPVDTGQWETVTTEEMLRHIEEGTAILVDARKPEYYHEGHIPGAINLPAIEFGTAFQEIGESLPREFPIVVYCQGDPCDESHMVLEHLKQYDFQSLYLYQDGWMEWEKQALPVEQ